MGSLHVPGKDTACYDPAVDNKTSLCKTYTDRARSKLGQLFFVGDQFGPNLLKYAPHALSRVRAMLIS